MTATRASTDDGFGHPGFAVIPVLDLRGGRVVRAPEPVHGKVWDVTHGGTDIFAGVPSPFRATRYHSLVVEDLPETLIPTARTADGLVMGLAHRDLPIWGVQFHPESIASEHGHDLLRNFLALSTRRNSVPA
jgi:anthranilate synthase component 2/anthranilate synthase/phosphoribosyltransferase